MEYAIIAVISAVVGFIAGALVYRKHSAQGDAIVQQLKELQDKIEKR
jgi:uncharacterized membrane-anchored protein YhcB (DUF1043 family)